MGRDGLGNSIPSPTRAVGRYLCIAECAQNAYRPVVPVTGSAPVRRAAFRCREASARSRNRQPVSFQRAGNACRCFTPEVDRAGGGTRPPAACRVSLHRPPGRWRWTARLVRVPAGPVSGRGPEHAGSVHRVRGAPVLRHRTQQAGFRAFSHPPALPPGVSSDVPAGGRNGRRTQRVDVGQVQLPSHDGLALRTGRRQRRRGGSVEGVTARDADGSAGQDHELGNANTVARAGAVWRPLTCLLVSVYGREISGVSSRRWAPMLPVIRAVAFWMESRARCA